MKKIPLLICVIFFAVKSFAQDKQVALVSFYTVKQVGFVDKPSQQDVLNSAKLADDTAWHILPILKSFRAQFFKNDVNKFPFRLLPERQVLGNRDYRQFMADNGNVNDILNFKTNLPVPGYQALPDQKKNENEKNMLAIFPGCDGIMKVVVKFDLDRRGVGPKMALVKVKASATISLFNKKGEKVFETTESALSQLSGSQIAGIPFMVPKKLLPLCENAADELLITLQNDMPGIAQKAGAKL
jgi:hypothetical protein